MKLAYIVRGSEDGNLGIYTSVTKAYNKARWYVTQNGETNPTSFAKARVKLAQYNWVQIECEGHRGHAEIEAFELNA